MEDHKKEPEVETENATIDLDSEMTMTIRGIQYTVTAHYDDTQEDLPTKVARLLKKDVSEMIRPTIPPEESV
jgi:hypothetical protein